MEVFRRINSSRFVAVCLTLVIILLFSHKSLDSEIVATLVEPKPVILLRTPYESESIALQRVLKRASTSDRLVILTFADKVSATPGSTLDQFLESLRIGEGTQRWLHHTVVITEDRRAFRYCKTVHPHCFFPRNNSMDESTRLRFNSGKIDLLKRVVQFGYAIIFTTVDMMWLRNPMYELDPVSQMTIACDLYDSGMEQRTGIERDTPFFHVKSDAMVLEFVKYWNLITVLFPNSERQALCGMSLYDDISQQLGMKISFLRGDNFGEICQPTIDFAQVYAVNAECCGSVDSKVHDLKLLLEDLKNLRDNNSSIADSSFSRKAQYCRMKPTTGT